MFVFSGCRLGNFDELDGSVFVHFGDVAFWFFEEVGGDESEDGGSGNDGEEGGGIDEGEDGEEGHGANVSVSSSHSGDLASHAALDEGNHGEDCPFTRLDEEGTSHGGKNCEGDRPVAVDLAEGEVANGEADEEDDHSTTTAEAVAEPSTTGTGGKVHEGEAGGEKGGFCHGKAEGVCKETWEHGDNSELRAEGDEVVDVEDGDLFEGVALVFGDVSGL